MEFRILGPLEVRNARTAVALGGSSRARCSPCLLLHPNEPVSAERLAVALWGEEAPGAARQDGAGARVAAAQGAG